jgi:hypothetical protein
VTLRRHSGGQIRPSFLWRKMHIGSINERPVAKANLISILHSGALRPLLPPTKGDFCPWLFLA